jgi:hypothetical protein
LRQTSYLLNVLFSIWYYIYWEALNKNKGKGEKMKRLFSYIALFSLIASGMVAFGVDLTIKNKSSRPIWVAVRNEGGELISNGNKPFKIDGSSFFGLMTESKTIENVDATKPIYLAVWREDNLIDYGLTEKDIKQITLKNTLFTKDAQGNLITKSAAGNRNFQFFILNSGALTTNKNIFVKYNPNASATGIGLESEDQNALSDGDITGFVTK